MPPFSYLTIQGPVEGIHKEKGSKFLAFAFPVTTEDQVKSHLKSLKKKFFDARHHGYACILGLERKSTGHLMMVNRPTRREILS